MPEPTDSATPTSRVRIVVASTVMLTFISFWSAAAVVLNDLASSAFYAVGIAEQDFGKSAPWVVLAVMLFAFSVRATYVESCSMFTRGGVYRVVKEGLGGTFAKVSVSALMFDYILTGPVSGVSAGQYIAGMLNELLRICAEHQLLGGLLLAAPGRAMQVPVNATAAILQLSSPVLLVVERQRNRSFQQAGCRRHENHHLNGNHHDGVGSFLRRIQGSASPAHPIPSNFTFTPSSFGFLEHTSLTRTFGLFGILMAFGHTVLAMSGEETLAQVNREIQHPKLKNLKRAAIVIAIYSLIFTGGASLLAVMLIPDQVRVPVYGDNVIAGIAMYMVGPLALRVAFRIFVVIVGFLILAGAINTSIIGSTGVLMRVAEDGVLHDWFRKPQRKFGTPTRIINLVTGAAAGYHCVESWRHHRDWRSLRVRRDLEFYVQWARDAGDALSVTMANAAGKCLSICALETPNFQSVYFSCSWFFSAPQLSI